MERVKKDSVCRVIEALKVKGYSQEEIAVKLGRTQQTIWAWGSKAKMKRVPCLAEYKALIEILNTGGIK